MNIKNVFETCQQRKRASESGLVEDLGIVIDLENRQIKGRVWTIVMIWKRRRQNQSRCRTSSL